MNVTKSKMLLLLQSALCVILVVMLAAAAIGIYRDGVAEKQENPLAWIYTREKAAAALNTVMPVAVLAVAVTVTCAVLGVRDEEQDKPVKDIELMRNLMAERVAEPSAEMKKEQALQRKLRYGGWAAFGLCMLPIRVRAVHAADPAVHAQRKSFPKRRSGRDDQGAGRACAAMGSVGHRVPDRVHGP